MSDDGCPPEFEKMEAMKKIFAGNLPKDATDDEVKEFFMPYGGIADFKCIKKPGNKVFAFITYQKCEEVDELLLLKPLSMAGRELQIRRAVPKDDTHEGAQARTKKIFFANVEDFMTEETVREYLEKRHPAKYGKITSLKLIKKKDDPSGHRGYGFIECDNEDIVDRITIGDRKCHIVPNSTKEQEFKKSVEQERGQGGFGGRGGGRGGARGGFQRGGMGGGAGGYAGAGGYGAAAGSYGAAAGGYGAQAGGYGGYGGGYQQQQGGYGGGGAGGYGGYGGGAGGYGGGYGGY